MKKSLMTEKICTLEPKSECASCRIKGELSCKLNKNKAITFFYVGMPPLILNGYGFIILGMLTGHWWMLIAFVLFTGLMFGFVEMGFLCRHCPYYAADGAVLKCLGNNGSFKLWSFNPAPMNQLEKWLMRVFVFGYFLGLPVLEYGYGLLVLWRGQSPPLSLWLFAGMVLGSLAVSIVMIRVLFAFYCTKCVNFSCPFNTVEKAIVDEYLKKNPVLLAAWEKNGYHLD